MSDTKKSQDLVQELCEKFTEATGFVCSAEQDNYGQIVIYTNLAMINGELCDMDTGEEVESLRRA